MHWQRQDERRLRIGDLEIGCGARHEWLLTMARHRIVDAPSNVGITESSTDNVTGFIGRLDDEEVVDALGERCLDVRDETLWEHRVVALCDTSTLLIPNGPARPT